MAATGALNPTPWCRSGLYSVQTLHYAAIVCLLVCCMFACVLYVWYVVIWSVLCSNPTPWRRLWSNPTPWCRSGLYSVQTLHYAAIVCLLVCCMFACVLYQTCLVCGDLVCTLFKPHAMAAIGSLTPRHGADRVSTLYKPYTMQRLYVCLCVVCLLVCCMHACVLYVVCGDLVCTLFKPHAMRRLVLSTPRHGADRVSTLYKPYTMRQLYVCLCVVCLLVCCMFAMWWFGLYSVQTPRHAAIGSVNSKRHGYRSGLYSVQTLHYAAIVCLLVCCMFACVLYVCYVVIGSVLCSDPTRCGDWVCALQTPRCASIGSLLCTNPTLCGNCMFACVLYVCLCVVCLLCGDWVCTLFRPYAMRRLGLCSPNPTLYYVDWVSTAVQTLHYAAIVCLLCVLYVCLCVVCLLCGDWVCTLFRHYEMQRLGLCFTKPRLYYSIGTLLCKSATLLKRTKLVLWSVKFVYKSRFWCLHKKSRMKFRCLII